MVASSRPAHSRTTLNLRKDLLDRARRLSGIKKKTDLVHAGLQALIAREALRRLASMGGAYPNAKAPPRRRWPKSA
jgi:hypothetical protein